MECLAGYAAGVHGRAAEFARIEGFLDDVISGPVALLMEGAAGIGKTTLWSAGIDLARRRGCWVLTCRPVQSEAALSFSALGDLLESVPEQVLAGLPRPQCHALDVALLRAEPGPEPPDQRAVAVALLGVIRALADTAPVVVGVDDLPWLDRASATVFGFVARRLTGTRVGLIAASRTGEESLFTRSGLPEINVEPLGDEAARDLIGRRFPAIVRPMRERVLLEAQGNPLAIVELCAA